MKNHSPTSPKHQKDKKQTSQESDNIQATYCETFNYLFAYFSDIYPFAIINRVSIAHETKT